MSVKIQLLTIDELEDGKRYRAVYSDGSNTSPFTRMGGINLHPCAIGYTPADAIEFVPPDPDKALIEGFCRAHEETEGVGFIKIDQTGIPGRVWRIGFDCLGDLLRAFLDYQRAQSK